MRVCSLWVWLVSFIFGNCMVTRCVCVCAISIIKTIIIMKNAQRINIYLLPINARERGTERGKCDWHRKFNVADRKNNDDNVARKATIQMMCAQCMKKNVWLQSVSLSVPVSVFVYDSSRTLFPFPWRYGYNLTIFHCKHKHHHSKLLKSI